MKKLEEFVLQRMYHGADCTTGVLYHKSGFFCFTLELPWRYNQVNISCIPEGTYTVEKYKSKKYPDHFEITNVPGRTYILMHEGNTTKDVVGCVALGKRQGELYGNKAVLRSRQALGELRRYLKKLDIDEFCLIVRDLP